MTPLRTENLEMKLEGGVAYMSVSGTMSTEALEQGLAWIDGLVEANDNFNICVDMAKDNFEDLSAASAEFRRVGRVLRHAQTSKKCAVLTDSNFIRNSAKVEGSVLLGMDLNTFDLSEAGSAARWLRGEPMTAPKTLAEIREAVDTPENPRESAEAESAWDNLKFKNVDY